MEGWGVMSEVRGGVDGALDRQWCAGCHGWTRVPHRPLPPCCPTSRLDCSPVCSCASEASRAAWMEVPPSSRKPSSMPMPDRPVTCRHARRAVVGAG